MNGFPMGGKGMTKAQKAQLESVATLVNIDKTGLVDVTADILSTISSDNLSNEFIFPKGVYLLSGLDLNGISNVILRGQGKETILRVASETFGIRLRNCSNIQIKDMVIENTFDVIDTQSCGVDAQTPSEGSVDILIENVEINGFWNGIRTNVDSIDWTLNNVKSTYNKFAGLMGGSSGHRYINCDMSNNGSSKLHHGIYLNALDGDTIDDIQVIGGRYVENGGDGIMVATTSDNATLSNVKIIGATIDKSGSALDSTTSNKAYGIAFTATGTDSVVKDCIATACTVRESLGDGGCGIGVINNCYNIKISSNIVDTMAVNGIEIGGVNTEDCSIVDNDCVDMLDIGILVSRDNCDINNNRVDSGNGYRGIRVTGSRVKIMGNRVKGTFSSDSIRLESSSESIVSSNDCVGNIRLSSGCTGSLASGNISASVIDTDGANTLVNNI